MKSLVLALTSSLYY
uniref:Uncharacterized protein n=1 Tax=Rhizophora mucronata TaxID=61149 RepID=A0A2P2Q7R7_RHIMU